MPYEERWKSEHNWVDEKGRMGFGALNSVNRILNMKEAGEIFTVSNIFEFHQDRSPFLLQPPKIFFHIPFKFLMMESLIILESMTFSLPYWALAKPPASSWRRILYQEYHAL